ncbi:hypothetical protein [Streptomyces sp. BF23-19]
MTSADAPSQWTEPELTGLHRIALRELLRHVSPAPGAEHAGVGRPVLGVLRPPGRPGHTRVVLWDGRDLGSSVAYDLPLVDADDSNVPWPAIAGTVRRLAARPGAADGPAARDGLGIPVVDATAEAARFGAEPSYDRTDALHAAVSMLRPFHHVEPEPDPDPESTSASASDPEPELLLGGFLPVGPRVRAAVGAYRHIARS